jgi:hypothetical protein
MEVPKQYSSFHFSGNQQSPCPFCSKALVLRNNDLQPGRGLPSKMYGKTHYILSDLEFQASFQQIREHNSRNQLDIEGIASLG